MTRLGIEPQSPVLMAKISRTKSDLSD